MQSLLRINMHSPPAQGVSVLQALTELDPETTFTSIDGTMTCDIMSRRVMFQGSERSAGERVVLSFVRLFYSFPFAYL